jgi:hypothetical protein
MHKAKNLFVYLFVLVFSAGTLFAQSSANSSANVKVQIKKGLSISNIGGTDLDFGETILTGAAQTISKTPGTGVAFEVTGHPNKVVSVTFAGMKLYDALSNELDFTPTVMHTLNDPGYNTPLGVTSGDGLSLEPVAGVGKLYLWLGGDIIITGAVEGDYTGSFSMTVAY